MPQTTGNEQTYPFTLQPLPYDYSALEPNIGAETVQIHHNHHLKTYVGNLNKNLADYPQYQKWTLTQLLLNIPLLDPKIQTAVKNNAGGVYNHNLYFSILSATHGQMPSGDLSKAINLSFNGYDNWISLFTQASKDVFGSGYAWLVLDCHANRQQILRIVTTANQDTPLPRNLCPILNLDVWEHAYYLDYQYRRPEYIENWFRIINWQQAETNFLQCLAVCNQ